MSDALLLREDQNGVAWLTMNNPAKLNALSDEMLAALQGSFDAIAQDEAVKAVVLRGAGKAFCAGHDLRQMTQARQSADGGVAAFGDLFDRCVAETGTRFGVNGVNIGLFCSTPMVALSRNIHTKQAFEMLVTGEFIDAARARELGLVNRVADDLEYETSKLAALLSFREFCGRSSAFL